MGGRRSRGLPSMADINVTPFVDVVLVLLIIFIITAHVMDYGIEVQVPKTKTVATSTKDLPVVLLGVKGDLYLNHDRVQLVDLVNALHTRFPGQNSVFVRADGGVTWELLAQVGAKLGEGKFNIQLVTEPANSGSHR
ncbi:MAG TPA: biopolymer transporter ExbD [Bryobacteraceae bacterium]|nr:biopolymer transporter ExbD [Bryobacteraceae bacterium]